MDNHADQMLKGRQLKGSQQAAAKLSEEIVVLARGEYSEGVLGYGRLSRKYGVTRAAMRNAIHGVKNWKHVPGATGGMRLREGLEK